MSPFILDTNGEIVVKYTYDAWGNHKVLDSNGVENTQATFVGNINPYRYRGYYYDSETGLYFLKTRYYDPMVGRFISMDDVAYIDPETIGGLNLFAYCNNNPVMNVDPSGHSSVLGFLLTVVISAAISFSIDVGTQLHKNDWNFSAVDLGSAFNSAIVGGAMGAVFSLGVGVLGPVIAGSATASWGTSLVMSGVSAIASFGAGVLGYSVEELWNDRTLNIKDAMIQGAFTALEGIINYTFGGFVGSFGKVGTATEHWKTLLEKFYIKPFEIIFEFTKNALNGEV